MPGPLFSAEVRGAPRLINEAFGVDSNADIKALVKAYWKMDEASGQRNDSGPSGYHLTDNNTVMSGTGQVYPLAGDFVAANLEYLSRADPFYLSSLTIEAWIKPTTATGLHGIVTKDGSPSPGREWLLFQNGGTASLQVFSDDGTLVTASIATLVGGSWHQLIAWFDNSDKTARIVLNNSAPVASGVLPGPIQDTPTALQVGNRAIAAMYFDGRIGPIGLYTGVLTADQRSRLWNGGAGLALY